MEVIESFLAMEAAENEILSGTWTKISKHSPQQANYTDCGVFICMNARNLTDQTIFKFHLDISSTRRQIKAELINANLL